MTPKSAKAEPGAKPSVYEYSEYKKYLQAWLDSLPNGGRGGRSRIAETVRCHLAYVSLVLNGSAHFSLEQGFALNPLFEHGPDEAEFFLLLLEKARAGTEALRAHFEERIRRVVEQRRLLENRLVGKKSLSIEDQTTYYSHWAYSAVHMAVRVPALRNARAIARHFGLTRARAESVIDFLERNGLVRKESGELRPTDVQLHLRNESPMIARHHANFRVQTLRALDRETPRELHYSSVVSIGSEDVPRVREILIQAIEQVRAVVKDSPDEAVYCYTLDLFDLAEERVEGG